MWVSLWTPIVFIPLVLALWWTNISHKLGLPQLFSKYICPIQFILVGYVSGSQSIFVFIPLFWPPGGQIFSKNWGLRKFSRRPQLWFFSGVYLLNQQFMPVTTRDWGGITWTHQSLNQQATVLDARASRVKWPAQFMSHWYGILFTE